MFVCKVVLWIDREVYDEDDRWKYTGMFYPGTASCTTTLDTFLQLPIFSCALIRTLENEGSCKGSLGLLVAFSL